MSVLAFLSQGPERELFHPHSSLPNDYAGGEEGPLIGREALRGVKIIFLIPEDDF